MAALVVRLAYPADAGVLHELAAETLPLACPPGLSQADISEFIKTHLSEEAFRWYLTNPTRVVWLAESDQHAVGYAMAVLGEPGDGAIGAMVAGRPTAELSKIYARAGQHGLGVGQALMDAFLVWAREQGCVSVWLGVNQQNHRANAFYERSGFTVVGEREFLVGQAT